MAPRLNVGSASMHRMTPEVMTLWILVGIEILLHVGLRRFYRRHHGG